MIIEMETVPLKLIGLSALERRLIESSSRADFIRNELRIVQAGVNGESKLKRVFEKYVFPFEHYIFHGLQLTSTGRFQIDTLFVSKKGIFVIEMKNIAGKIYFPPDRNQLVRTLENGQIDAFECPTIQVERNCMLLKDWFQARRLEVPITGLSVFAEVKQQFENIRPNMKLLFPMEIPSYFRKVEYEEDKMNAVTLKKIVSKLKAGHINYNPFPLCKTYSIPEREIKKGIICEECECVGMLRAAGKWVCPYCRNSKKNAHERAIVEMVMLLGNGISNKECRAFLGIKDSSTTKRLLTSMRLSSSGENKGRRYHIDDEMISAFMMDFPRTYDTKRR